MQIIQTVAGIRDALIPFRQQAESVGLVPTMGALHEGHLSLVRRSIDQTDRTIVSIFVNPTQFGPGEDLEAYPRPHDRDLERLDQAGVDIAFLPSETEMYPADCTTRVLPPAVANRLEGQSRPGHFQGVCTVVLKLFLQVLPDHAFFGQKDYQQVAVIRQMIRDLNVPIDLVICPTVREPDGLAMSSRNVYLSTGQRPAALGLYRALTAARLAVQQGEVDGHAVMNEMRQTLIDAGVDSIDYAVVADPDTLEVLDQIGDRAIGLVACRVGTTRLIDNLVLTMPSDMETGKPLESDS